jgi:hypothetical protein
MKYIVICKSSNTTTYYGTFYTEHSAKVFIAAQPKEHETQYDISVIYATRVDNLVDTHDILYNKEGTSPPEQLL